MVQQLSLSASAQYVLDGFGSVAEAVEELSQERFTVLTAGGPGQPRDATMHLAISDPTGDSAIFEYLDGRLDIHHDRSCQVMTNSPPFGEQLAINAYWHDIGGTVMLPGTIRASRHHPCLRPLRPGRLLRQRRAPGRGPHRGHRRGIPGHP